MQLSDEWSPRRIVDWIIRNSEHTKEQGDRFERLMRLFFLAEPSWSEQFDDVWLWDDWPGSDGPDHGIDLVAKNAGSDTYTAIQAKCYAASTPVQKSEIDSFISASNRPEFTRRVFVSTGHVLSANALKELDAASPPVTKIGLADLERYDIDWSQWSPEASSLARTSLKRPMPHQIEALEAVLDAFRPDDPAEAVDRGQLIMACGTGKTYTAQLISEQVVDEDGLVLVLAPSIALISQTITAWYADRTRPFTAFSICSDPRATGDTSDLSPYDLVVPATTDPAVLVSNVKRAPRGLRVVFSTYQSLPKIEEAQSDMGLAEFDLVICDEAHRTTGTTATADTPAGFRLVHHDDHIRAQRRLYMTATPRVYSESVVQKAKADRIAKGDPIWVASMDDTSIYGERLYEIGFREAVNLGLLVDYKVLVFGVPTTDLQALFTQGALDEAKIPAEEAAKWVGCLNALAKREQAAGHVRAFDEGDTVPLQRAVAFTSRISKSKDVERGLPYVADQFQTVTGVDGKPLALEVAHVDGTQSASTRVQHLAWLEENPGDDVCRILTNAQCLTEGIDVPALDAIVLLEPRQSVIDIVQAVGRVMRSSTDPVTGKEKKFGYIIIPVPVLPGQSVEDRIKSRGFKAVWQVLAALRAHDPDLNHEINMLRFADTQSPDDPNPIEQKLIIQGTLEFASSLAELKEQCWAEMVRRVGDVHYLSRWTKTVADTAAALEQRIAAVIERRGVSDTFDQFVAGLRKNLNERISNADAVALLAQHLITEPVFDSMFPDYLIAASNPVAKSMRAMVDALTGTGLDAEIEDLEGFYGTVRDHVRGLERNPRARQKILIQLYEEFFQTAFPKQADALGIVYTPTEVTDFVIHAANDALRTHFDGASLTDEGIHVLDPFTGTGTFIVQMLNSGLIEPHDLARKFTNELHANELQLLAYYIATVNIETAYHALTSGDPTKPVQAFPGIVYADTFQLAETASPDQMLEVFPRNHERAARQNDLDIRVIVGNPPYSVGQTRQNDNNANSRYPTIDNRILNTYARQSNARLKRNLYNSYVRALRRASDQVLASPQGGVVSFVTNGGFIHGTSFDGLRSSLLTEFNHVYCFDLRGDQNTSGQRSRDEGGKIFDSKNRAPVAITLLVKTEDPIPPQGGTLHYRDIGDGLDRQTKLDILAAHATAPDGTLGDVEWETSRPPDPSKWVNQADDDYSRLYPLVDTDGSSDNRAPIFRERATGLATGRDSWNHNYCNDTVLRSSQQMTSFYNSEVDRIAALGITWPKGAKERTEAVSKLVRTDSKKISWTRSDYTRIANGEKYETDAALIRPSTYRPYTKQWVNFHPRLNSTLSQLPRIFPADPEHQRLAIAIKGKSRKAGFGCLMVDTPPSLHVFVGGTVVLPRHIDPKPNGDQALFDTQEASAIDPAAVEAFRQSTGNTGITDDDLFYYVYGVLHSSDYRTRYESSLETTSPRVPIPDNAATFQQFASAGRQLANLHLNYEQADRYPLTFPDDPPPDRIEKLRFGKGTPATSIIINDNWEITDLPARAHDYTIGSRSALAWIVDQYAPSTDAESDIDNDPNEWSPNGADYIIDLIGRLATVSVQTIDIIDGLPPLLS